jgi:MFS family permease
VVDQKSALSKKFLDVYDCGTCPERVAIIWFSAADWNLFGFSIKYLLDTKRFVSVIQLSRARMGINVIDLFRVNLCILQSDTPTRRYDRFAMSAEATETKSAAITQEGRRWWLFTACVLVSLTNEVSTAVTNLSLGPMRRDLGASSAVMQMAVTLGKLMLGAFMLAGGVAGDVYGRRRVLVLGTLGMVGASLLAAVAQTGGMLLLARALDGLASAAIGPMALALIAGAFSQAEQARVIGLFLGLSGLGASLGPLGAGLVVQAQGWRAGFLMPAAMAALGGLGVFRFVYGNGAKTKGRHLDGIGALTCAVGLLGLVFGIIQINQVGLLHPRVLQSVALGIGALLAFVWWERRVRDPLLDVTIFRNRTVSVAVTAGLLAALVITDAWVRGTWTADAREKTVA